MQIIFNHLKPINLMNTFLRYYTSSSFILILAVAGILYGYFFPTTVELLKPWGLLFVQLIKMLLIPIIVITILNAILNIKSENKFIKVGIFTFSYFFITSFFAAIAGLVLALFLKPGLGVDNLPLELLNLGDSLKAYENQGDLSGWAFVFSVIPDNFILAMSENKLLAVVFFTVFLGFALVSIKNPSKDVVINFVKVLNDALMWMMSKIMLLAPIAVFSFMAYLVGTLGFDILKLAGKLIGIVILGDIIWIYVVLAGMVLLFSKVSYFSFIKNIIPVQLIAFSTASSIVALPTNMAACEKMKLNKNYASFILPLGATLNMNGSALFYAIVTIFFMQFFSIEHSLSTYLLIALMAAIGSLATPGVPGLSLTIIMVLGVANVPLIGLPLIFAIDKILDMFTTTVNVIGDTSCVALADKIK